MRTARNVLRALALATLALAVSAPAEAGLDVFYSATGRLAVSVDAAGSNEGSQVVQVHKPSTAATVRAAFLLAASNKSTEIADEDIFLAGNPIFWDQMVINDVDEEPEFFHSYLADVTSLVASSINSASAGRVNFTVVESRNDERIDGEMLVVIFDDPTVNTLRTVMLAFGGQTTGGDTFHLTLGDPIDPSAEGAIAAMGLGVTFSFQDGGAQMFSQIDVNNTRLTTAAGGSDDGGSVNGTLITVGGLDDSSSNPANPNATPTNKRSDDELYTLLPFMDLQTTSLNIHTVNPSDDENLMFAWFLVDGAAVIGEGVVVSPAMTSVMVGRPVEICAHVVDDLGEDVEGAGVDFAVESGPNAGINGFCIPGDCRTDSEGVVCYNYTGVAGNGKDTLVAFIDVNGNDQPDQDEAQSRSMITWFGQTVSTTTIPPCCDGACGDANLDTAVTATDALYILDASLGNRECDLCLCDVDKSFAVTATDALMTLKRGVGGNVRLRCPLVGPNCPVTTSTTTTTTLIPYPTCEPMECGEYRKCSPNDNHCEQPVCGAVVDGGGYCVEGRTPCEMLPGCDTHDDCPDNTLCFAMSCCDRTVCMPFSAFCSAPITEAPIDYEWQQRAVLPLVPAGESGAFAR